MIVYRQRRSPNKQHMKPTVRPRKKRAPSGSDHGSRDIRSFVLMAAPCKARACHVQPNQNNRWRHARGLNQQKKRTPLVPCFRGHPRTKLSVLDIPCSSPSAAADPSAAAAAAAAIAAAAGCDVDVDVKDEDESVAPGVFRFVSRSVESSTCSEERSEERSRAPSGDGSIGRSSWWPSCVPFGSVRFDPVGRVRSGDGRWMNT